MTSEEKAPLLSSGEDSAVDTDADAVSRRSRIVLEESDPFDVYIPVCE